MPSSCVFSGRFLPALAGACVFAFLVGCVAERQTIPLAQQANARRSVAEPGVSGATDRSGAVDPDLVLFGADPARQLSALRGRPVMALQQHSFAELGRDFDPDVDPTGKFIVFASTRHSRKPNLYMKSISGRAVTQLTDDPASEIQPRFSPDGRRIAFASDRAGQWDIYILDMGRRTVTQVTSDEANELAPVWSPDGKCLAYSRLSPTANRWELWIVNLSDGSKRFIGEGLMPRWSPDGSRIAFQRPRRRDGMLFSIWVVSLKSGEPGWPTEIAAEPDAALVCPCWSPDGKVLAYCRVPVKQVAGVLPTGSTRPQRADIWIVSADGSGPVPLTDGGANFSPCWSRDGRIFFCSNKDGREAIWSVRLIQPAAGVLAADTSRGSISGSEGGQ